MYHMETQECWLLMSMQKGLIDPLTQPVADIIKTPKKAQ